MRLLIEGLIDPTLLDKFDYQTIMVANICIILQTGSQFILPETFFFTIKDSKQ